jgi:AbrB family looped-hinge helix DNA binding protein
MEGRCDMGSVTLSSKFQISIPKEVREKQGWKAGDKFAFVPRGDGGYAFVKVPTLEELAGSAQGADTTGYRDRNDRY